jgi:hypothetical protein
MPDLHIVEDNTNTHTLHLKGFLGILLTAVRHREATEEKVTVTLIWEYQKNREID